MANTRHHHHLIYQAALKQDQTALSKLDEYKHAAPKKRIKSVLMSPLFRLAAEGKQAAVDFLIQHGYPLEDAIWGYAFSDNQNELKRLEKKHLQHYIIGTCFPAHQLKGYAYANNEEAVNRILDHEENPSLASIACEIYAENGNTTAVEALTAIYKNIKVNTLCAAYARGGHAAQVNELIANGANPKIAYDNYIKHDHLGKAHQLLVRTQYERQLKQDQSRVKLVILFAFILTPLSLFFSLPYLFWLRHNDPIKRLTVSEKEIDTVKDVRRTLRHGQNKMRDQDNYTKKVNLGKNEGMQVLLVDKPQADRFKLFSKQDTYAIARHTKKAQKQQQALNAERAALKEKSKMTHQWLSEGQPFAEQPKRMAYREYMALTRK